VLRIHFPDHLFRPLIFPQANIGGRPHLHMVMPKLSVSLNKEAATLVRWSLLLFAPAAGAGGGLAEPAQSFRAVIAHDDDIRPEPMANRVIRSAASWLFWRGLLLLQQKLVKLVIFTHRRLNTNSRLRRSIAIWRSAVASATGFRSREIVLPLFAGNRVGMWLSCAIDIATIASSEGNAEVRTQVAS
jgi:hypothetical protein